ncbi:hypothetical protein Trydic_g21455 [Trypoxylus dichotomus]
MNRFRFTLEIHIRIRIMHCMRFCASCVRAHSSQCTSELRETIEARDAVRPEQRRNRIVAASASSSESTSPGRRFYPRFADATVRTRIFVGRYKIAKRSDGK